MFNKRLAALAWPVKSMLALTVGFSLLTGMVIVGQAFLLSRVIDRVFMGGASLADVRGLLIALFVLSLLRAGLTLGGGVTAQRVAGWVKTSLRRNLHARLMAFGPLGLRAEQSGELANTLTEGVEALDAWFSQYLPQLATAALVPLTVLLVVFPLDPLSGLVLLLTAPLIPVFMVLIGNTAEGLTRKQWLSMSRMSAYLLDVLQGLATLKVLGQSRAQLETIRRVSYRFRDATMAVLRVAFLSALVLELVATLSTAVVAVEVGLRLLAGRLAFAEALFVLILAPEFYIPMRMLGARFHAAMSGQAAARRIFELLDTPSPRPMSPARPAPIPGRLDLRFEDVDFTYDDSDRPALTGVSFDLPAGKTVALVGPNGAGKSTVAHLLMRFAEPDAGQITVGGVPLAGLDVAAWRRQIAWVPQRPHLFHATIAENIRLAKPDAGPDEVARAARLARADAFIEALPQGYETVIGERGARLSGGQAQRLALARAYLKDAPILILDEATAHLDARHEQEIHAALATLMAGRTVLLIAHRLNTVAAADTILVMSGGTIIESGSHAALMARQGAYHRLVAAYGGAG